MSFLEKFPFRSPAKMQLHPHINYFSIALWFKSWSKILSVSSIESYSDIPINYKRNPPVLNTISSQFALIKNQIAWIHIWLIRFIAGFWKHTSIESSKEIRVHDLITYCVNSDITQQITFPYTWVHILSVKYIPKYLQVAFLLLSYHQFAQISFKLLSYNYRRCKVGTEESTMPPSQWCYSERYDQHLPCEGIMCLFLGI